MGSFEIPLMIGSALVVCSVITSKASSRLGIPVLLLFLLIGMVTGTHGWGHIPFTSFLVAQRLGALALVFILFSGGMSTQLATVRPVWKPALVLSTVGVIFSTALVGAFAYFFLRFTLIEGFLLGAIIASTDVAAVFAVFRSKRVGLKAGLGPLLELESALNDPMAVFLGVALLDLLAGKQPSALMLIPFFFRQMVLGSLIGWASGRGAVFFINRIKLEYEGLYPVFSLGWVILTYAATQALGGSGFLAVYLTGIVIGNTNLLHRKSLVHFHEGVAWLGQIAMFLAMGLLVDPRELWTVAAMGTALSAFLVLVARPVSVFLCLPGSRFSAAEKGMISWAGLRGAVPIILASYVLAMHIPKAIEIFNLVFFVTLFSVLLQGTLIPFIAKWLKVNLPFQAAPSFPIEFNPTQDLRNKLVEVSLPGDATSTGRTLLELNLPKGMLVVLLRRGREIIVPNGGTQLQAGDTLLVLAENRSVDEVKRILLAFSR